jgi:hypothetical protein
MASLARTARRVALVATMAIWALTGRAVEAPPVLDEEGRLPDAFIEQLRRQDAAQWMQQYTVSYTEHILDYGYEWDRVEGGLRVVEFEGFVQADVVTGSHSVSQILTHAFPDAPRGVGSHTVSGPSYYSPQYRDPFRWACRVLAWGGRRKRRTTGVADILDGARLTSCVEESGADGLLLRIVTDRRDGDGGVASPAFRREIVLNLSRGYRPQQIVEHDERAGTRTETDIELSQHPEAGVWAASRVHQRVVGLRGDEALRQERIYEFTELTPRTHLRIRH